MYGRYFVPFFNDERRRTQWNWNKFLVGGNSRFQTHPKIVSYSLNLLAPRLILNLHLIMKDSCSQRLVKTILIKSSHMSFQRAHYFRSILIWYIDFTLYLVVHFVRSREKKVPEVTFTFFQLSPGHFRYRWSLIIDFYTYSLLEVVSNEIYWNNFYSIPLSEKDWSGIKNGKEIRVQWQLEWWNWFCPGANFVSDWDCLKECGMAQI